jgi:hypothetical protein
MTKTETTIRTLGITDLPLLMRAQVSASHELDAMTPEAVGMALAAGQFSGLVLEGEDRQMVVAWQRDGETALLSVLYREGSPNGMLSDCRRLLDRTEGVLREFGVTKVFCAVGVMNPRMERLMRLYASLGFTCDLIRMQKGI